MLIVVRGFRKRLPRSADAVTSTGPSELTLIEQVPARSSRAAFC